MKIWLWIRYCMHSYCTKLFHCKILSCLRKERLHIPVPILFVDLLSTPAFLVPTPVPCNWIPGVLNRPEKLAIPVSKACSNEFYICSNVYILSIYRDKNKRWWWWYSSLCTRHFISASSLKQQSMGRHVSSLRKVILIPSQPVFALTACL